MIKSFALTNRSSPASASDEASDCSLLVTSVINFFTSANGFSPASGPNFMTAVFADTSSVLHSTSFRVKAGVSCDLCALFLGIGLLFADCQSRQPSLSLSLRRDALSQIKLEFVYWLIPRWRCALQWRLTTLLYKRRVDDLFDDTLQDALPGRLRGFLPRPDVLGTSTICSAALHADGCRCSCQQALRSSPRCSATMLERC